jgi:hypothetical protein
VPVLSACVSSSVCQRQLRALHAAARPYYKGNDGGGGSGGTAEGQGPERHKGRLAKDVNLRPAHARGSRFSKQHTSTKHTKHAAANSDIKRSSKGSSTGSSTGNSIGRPTSAATPALVPVTGWLSYNDVCSMPEAKRSVVVAPCWKPVWLEV